MPLVEAGLVVAELDAGRGAVEELGREHHVAFGGDAIRDRADVRVDAEDLLEHAARPDRLVSSAGRAT